MFRHQSAIFREIMNTQDHKSNIPHFIVLRILNTMEKVILDIADIFHVQLLLRTWMLQFSTRVPGSEGGGTSFFQTNAVIHFSLAKSFNASQYFQMNDGPVYCLHLCCSPVLGLRYEIP